jgi:hypothetical protein
MSFGAVEVCAYPTLKATLMQASKLVAAPAAAVTAGNVLAWDLAWARTRLLDDTLRAFPSSAQTRIHNFTSHHVSLGEY